MHSICSAGRFRESFDSFWNLFAELPNRGINVKVIALTATLRPSDVPDVMKRLSLEKVSVFRRSCYRESLKFRFITQLDSEKKQCWKRLPWPLNMAWKGKCLFLLQQSNFAMMFRVVSASNHTMGERLF